MNRKTFPAAISATSAMTLFSYLLSYVHKNNFKEPENLAILVRRLKPYPAKSRARLIGWGVHYAVGLLFADLYTGLWEQTNTEPKVDTGLVLGGLSGLAAILIWKFTLSVHPNSPSINFKKYALNLFVGHLIFGVVAAVVYRTAFKDNLGPC